MLETNTTIILKRVRLAFPDLYQAVQYQGAGPYNYSATVLVEPNSSNARLVEKAIKAAADAKWGAKAAGILKSIEGSSQKCAWISGDMKAYEGFEGMMALSAKRPQDAGRPKVIDTDLSELTVESGRPYGGCFVNFKCAIWAQDNSFGKGIRATIVAVQFAGDGDSFGGAPAATSDGFEAVESEEELV